VQTLFVKLRIQLYLSHKGTSNVVVNQSINLSITAQLYQLYRNYSPH